MDCINYLRNHLDSEVDIVAGQLKNSPPSEFEAIINQSSVIDRFSEYFKVAGIDRALKYEVQVINKLRENFDSRNISVEYLALCWDHMFLRAHTSENMDNCGIDKFPDPHHISHQS